MAREHGFVAAAKAMGLPVLVERHGPTNYESGRVLAQRLLTLGERPDAVFCATDLLACGFMMPRGTSSGSPFPISSVSRVSTI